MWLEALGSFLPVTVKQGEGTHGEAATAAEPVQGMHPPVQHPRPDGNHWENGLRAIECALHLEISVNQSLFDLHQLATEKKVPHLCDFLERHYQHEQMKFIKELGNDITNQHKMRALESSLEEYLSGMLTRDDSNKN